MPSHQAGDLLLIFAYRTGSTTAPTVPTGSGYASVNSGTGGGGSNNSYAIGWKIATSSSDVSGTWTNATFLQCQVFRGQHATAPIGASSITTGQSSGTTITLPALTLQRTDGTSFVAGFYGHRTNFTPPTSNTAALTYRSSTNSASGSVGQYSTNAAVSSYSSQTVTISATSSNFIPASVEILDVAATRIFLIT